MRRFLSLLPVLAILIIGPGLAFAQAIGGRGGIFNGGTLTRGITFSGVTSDISTPANEDLTLTSGGTGIVNICASSTSNCLKVTTVEANGFALLHLYTTNVGRLLMFGDGTTIGTGYASPSVTTVIGSVSKGITSSGRTDVFAVHGKGALLVVPGDALSIGTTDTTSTPLGSGTTGAGTACRMSAAGASTWTPSETGVVDGMFFCCTNTGSNVITMTDSAGVYEGSGSAVGQWDTVCMEYVTDRWVQRSFQNN